MADFEESHKVIGVTTYALAAVLGVAAANYVEGFVPQNFGLLVGGLASMALPIWVIKDNNSYMGPVRMFFGVLGLTLIVRSIVGANGFYPQSGWPTQLNVITA